MSTTRPPCAMGRHVAGYALHALEPDDELAVLAHLPVCPCCTRALREHHATLALIGAAVPDATPPARLRERILRAAHGEPTPPVAGSGTPAEIPVQSRRPGQRRPRRRRRSVGRRVAASLLAAVVAIGVAGLAGQATDLAGQRDTATAQARDLGRIVTGLGAAGSVRATLTDGHGTPVAAVVATGDAVAVVTVDLPVNDAAGTVYVLWGLDGAAAPRALGTFDVGPAGPEVARLGTAPAMAGYAVSVEPGRTAPAVPTEVVASGQVVV